MAVVIALLRAVNVAGHQKISMEALRILCAGLGLRDVQTYIQSGNLVFREDGGDPAGAARRIEGGIEKKWGFRPDVVVRTVPELRKVVAKNPFAARPGIEPNRLLCVFTANTPTREACDRLLATPCEPEELRIHGREVYIHYPQGMAHPKLSLARIEKLLQTPSTGRNWNTVNKLLELAGKLED